MYKNNDPDYLKQLKKKRVVIFGAGENGKKAFYRLKKEGIEVTAFCDNDRKKQNRIFEGVMTLSFRELCEMECEDLMIIICSNFEREIKQQLMDHYIYSFISISQIDFCGGGGEAYYDEQYFAYQQEMGQFGGKIKVDIFKPYIKEDMIVVEFGSGGGFLLNNIIAKEKIGIELNDSARKAAEEIGIKSVKHINEIPDSYADLIISTSVLEHVEQPLLVLRELRNKLKEGGKAVFHVPNESCDTEYVRSEINNHLYTWNCLTLGNLFKAAGYFVHSVEKVQEVWPKHYMKIEQEVSPQLFETICAIGGRAFEENRCIIVAYK